MKAILCLLAVLCASIGVVDGKGKRGKRPTQRPIIGGSTAQRTGQPTKHSLPPTRMPSRFPTKRPSASPTLTSEDYSCLHASSWLVNRNNDYNSYFESSTEISQSYYDVTSGPNRNEKIWTIGYSGIPNYDHNVTAAEIATMNGRPNVATDFENGATTATTGKKITFGESVGYSSESCSSGYWPPGPGCPDSGASNSQSFPMVPSEAASGSNCYQSGTVGMAVNGATFFGATDAKSYKSEGIWQQMAYKFETYDVDFCGGHAANGVYHHHFYSPCLAARLGDTGSGHSPIYGFAWDGFPIYGPYNKADTLAVSCYAVRDYRNTSSTGCSDNKRSCKLVDQSDISKGVTAASKAGPEFTETISVDISVPVTAAAGVYVEDYYYVPDCAYIDDEYLDEHNGHKHGKYGYHYHITLDSDKNPVFPYIVGPSFYGCISSATGQACFTSLGGTKTMTSTCSSQTQGRSNFACTASSTPSLFLTHAPSMGREMPTQQQPSQQQGSIQPNQQMPNQQMPNQQQGSIQPNQQMPNQQVPSAGPVPTTRVPTRISTRAPTGPTKAPTRVPTSDTASSSSAYDYSCLHAAAWEINNSEKSAYFSTSKSDVQSSYYDSTSGPKNEKIWTVAYTGIPKYDHVMTAADITALNSRPKKSSDFDNGATSTAAGRTVKFGDDIGYSSTACTMGYWPPGPDCPETGSRSKSFTLNPAPETSSTGCWPVTTGSVGITVHGVGLFTWGDGNTYNSAKVWSNLAMEFEKYDIDICWGHAAQGEYHHHSYSPCIAERLGDSGTGHSPIYAFAYDGYPIHGPYQSANTLAVSCWQKRNYASSSPTGCSDSKRSCILKDPYDYTKGTSTASSSGPSLTGTVTSLSGNSISAVSGIYYEDYFYNATCGGKGGKYLNGFHGHSHGDYGFHYHMTIDSSGVPTFPYYIGPKFYGCLPPSAGTTCYSTHYGTITTTSTCGTTDGSSTFACTSSSTPSSFLTHAPSAGQQQQPSAGGPMRPPMRAMGHLTSASEPNDVAADEVDNALQYFGLGSLLALDNLSYALLMGGVSLACFVALLFLHNTRSRRPHSSAGLQLQQVEDVEGRIAQDTKAMAMLVDRTSEEQL